MVEVLLRVGREDLVLRDVTRRSWRTALEELLVAYPVYRAYVVPGTDPSDVAVAQVDLAVERASRTVRGGAAVALLHLRELALGQRGRSPLLDEFVVRFQQTCGPVMAKGVEDTAFYRWNRFVALNEVGGSPSSFGSSVAAFHEAALHRQREWPDAMTTLSTHDTKRSEDVRARLYALTELPDAWGEAVTRWRARAQPYRNARGWADATLEYLFWQTLVGAWPIDIDRMETYVLKAAREAKLHTVWTEPNAEYEDALRAFATSVLTDSELIADVGDFVSNLAPVAAANALGQKLLQLTMPGVPDVYQGTEIADLSLVDPDNRRPVDYLRRRHLLTSPDVAGDDAKKMVVTSTALRLRGISGLVRGQGDYVPLYADGRPGDISSRSPCWSSRDSGASADGVARAHRRLAGNDAVASRGNIPALLHRRHVQRRRRGGRPARRFSGRTTRPRRALLADLFGEQAGASGVDIEVGGRPLRVHVLKLLDEQLREGPVAVPLAVSGNDVPGGRCGVAALERCFVRRAVVVPEQPLIEIARIELPVLCRIVQAGEQPFALLLRRDVQEHLDDADAPFDQAALEAVDGRIATAPHRSRHEVMNADDEHVLVLRSIEDADDAWPWQRCADTPEEVVRQLFASWRPKRLDRHALRVDEPHRVLDGAALPGVSIPAGRRERCAARRSAPPRRDVLEIGQPAPSASNFDVVFALSPGAPGVGGYPSMSSRQHPREVAVGR